MIDAPLVGDRRRSLEPVGPFAPFLAKPASGRRRQGRRVPSTRSRHTTPERVEVVDGNPEEALNLRGVEVERDHAVRAGGFDRVGAYPCSNRDPRLVFLVALGIAEVGDDRGDRRRGCTFERVNRTAARRGCRWREMRCPGRGRHRVLVRSRAHARTSCPRRTAAFPMPRAHNRGTPRQTDRTSTRGPGEQQEVIHLEEATHSCVRGQPNAAWLRMASAPSTSRLVVRSIRPRGTEAVGQCR